MGEEFNLKKEKWYLKHRKNAKKKKLNSKETTNQKWAMERNGEFSKEEVLMAGKQVRGVHHRWLVNRQRQIKTTLRLHLVPVAQKSLQMLRCKIPSVPGLRGCQGEMK